MIRRILLALAGTRYTGIGIRYALELAQSHGAEVTGVTVADLTAISRVGPVPVGAAASASDLVEYRQAVTRERIEEAIADFQDCFKKAGVVHRVAREVGDPFETLIRQWRYHDLTILALRGLFEYGLDKHPEDYLIQIIQGGVRPILALAEEYRRVKRVLFAYNGSVESANAMKAFVRDPLWPNLTFKIACFGPKLRDSSQLLADAAAYCHAHGHEVEIEYLPTVARDGLLERATAWEIDLIVMGATRRSRIFRKVLGDTALRAIRDAEMPLFITQ